MTQVIWQSAVDDRSKPEMVAGAQQLGLVGRVLN